MEEDVGDHVDRRGREEPEEGEAEDDGRRVFQVAASAAVGLVRRGVSKANDRMASLACEHWTHRTRPNIDKRETRVSTPRFRVDAHQQVRRRGVRCGRRCTI